MSLWALLFRIVWIFAGPAALFITLVLVYENHRKGLGRLFDIAYFSMLLIIVLSRVLDQRSGMKQTATGDEATWKDAQQYIAGLVLIASAAWVAAYFLGRPS